MIKLSVFLFLTTANKANRQTVKKPQSNSFERRSSCSYFHYKKVLDLKIRPIEIAHIKLSA